MGACNGSLVGSVLNERGVRGWIGEEDFYCDLGWLDRVFMVKISVKDD